MKIIARNKKAFHDFEIGKRYEAGIVLTGSEVKALRAGKIGFADSFARIKRGEIFLYNLNIPQHSHSSHFNHEPTRTRKLLLHRFEIKKLERKTEIVGNTLVPLSIYFNDKGLVKIELGLATGRRKHDKKAHLMEKQQERQQDRAKKDYLRGM